MGLKKRNSGNPATSERMKKIPVAIREVLSTRSGGGCGVVVNLTTGRYYPLNKTAHDIWHAVDGERTVANLAARVCRKYKIRKNKAIADVFRYLLFLKRAGVVRWRA